MPKILNDDRDPVKRAIGIKLRAMKKEDPKALQELLASMSDKEAEEILYDHEIWLRDSQWIDLSNGSPIHFYCGARGSGKGYCGSATIMRAVEKHGVKHILLLAVAARDFRANMVPAIIDQYPPNHPNKPVWMSAKATLVWGNGAEAIAISSESGEDAVRGLNLEMIWADESAFYGRNEAIIDMALLALRKDPSIMITTTSPKATPKIIEWHDKGSDPDDKSVTLYHSTTYDNMENLSDIFISTVIQKYQNTRLGEAELEGKLILTNPGALWQFQTIARNTLDISEVPELTDIAIGVDPSVLQKKSSSKGRTPDMTGIIASGMGVDGDIYTLMGATGSYSMEGWISKVASIFDYYRNMRYTVSICAEINVIGANAIEMAFKAIGRGDILPFLKTVHATKSKIERASSYSLLAEQDKLKYVDGDYLTLLRTELTTFDGSSGQKSPNSMDAAVYSWSILAPPKRKMTKSFELFI